MEHYIIYLIIGYKYYSFLVLNRKYNKRGEQGKENRRKKKSIQEKSIEKEKKTSFTSIHPFSSLYFQIIQNPWLKINFFQILLEPYWSKFWYTIRVSKCVLLLSERALLCTTNYLLKRFDLHRKEDYGYSSPCKEDL